MKLKILSFAAIAMLFAACSSDEPNLPPEAENIPQVANPYRVSLDDALDNAETLLSQISEAETRSGRRVASVKYFTTPSTRSADSDTMLYLINYENDGGFALLSADSRLRPVYAISDEGSLNLEDTIYNKGLAMFARGVEAEIALLPITPAPGPVDTTLVTHDTIKTIIKTGGPLLNRNVRNWDKHAPYNNYCFTESGSPAAVCCASIALGQIMAYHEWPESYGEYTFDWTAMKAGENDDMVARFLYFIGISDNLNVSYGVNSSEAHVSRIISTFTNMRYVCDEYADFNENEICNMITGNNDYPYVATPVLIKGDHPEGDHAWVIDGFIQYRLNYTNNGFIYDSEVDDILWHCVWGWGGKSNGYFYWAKNQQFDFDIIEKNRDDNVPEFYDFGIYDDCEYIGGIIPVKPETAL